MIVFLICVESLALVYQRCAVFVEEKDIHNKEGNIINNGISTDIKEIKKIKKNNTKDNMTKIKILDETNNVLYESLIDAVGKRYIHSLSRKIRTTNEDTFVYHGISWKVIK